MVCPVYGMPQPQRASCYRLSVSTNARTRRPGLVLCAPTCLCRSSRLFCLCRSSGL